MSALSMETALFTVQVVHRWYDGKTNNIEGGDFNYVWWYKHYIKRRSQHHINAYSTVFPSHSYWRHRRLKPHPSELLLLRKCRGNRCWLEFHLELFRTIFVLETSNAAGMTMMIYLIHLLRKSQKLPMTSCSLTSHWPWHHPILRQHRKYSWRVAYHDLPKN